MQINLFENNFRFMRQKVGYDSLSYCAPERMEWVRDQFVWKGATVFVDEYCFSPVVDQVQTDFKVAWLHEPPGVKNTVSSIRFFQDKFDMIISYLPNDMLRVDPNKHICIPAAGSWIQPQGVFQKSKKVSLIASDKRFTFGHRLRHEIVDITRGKVDIMGSGYRSIESKVEGLGEYFYSVVVENEKYPRYFTEKIVDCFLCRCIPIYWGATDLSVDFDVKGILSFETKEEAAELIDSVDVDLYHSLSDAVEHNYHAALKYARVDDVIHDEILRMMKAKVIV